MKIIGLTGAAGSGKDTVCGFIKDWGEENGVEVRRFAFADSLKESAARSLGVFSRTTQGHVDFCNRLKQPDVQIHITKFHPGNTGPDPEPPEWEPITEITGREFLQFFGTEGHRDVFGEEFWVEQLFARIKQRCQGFDGVVVITDVRFPNEAAAVNATPDGEVWEVVRPNQTKVEAHTSEAGLPDGQVEFDIHNDGDLTNLRNLTFSVCEHNLA